MSIMPCMKHLNMVVKVKHESENVRLCDTHFDILLSYHAIFLSQMLIFQFGKLILYVIVVEGFSVPVRYGVVWGKELFK